jgi:hypothetical protein
MTYYYYTTSQTSGSTIQTLSAGDTVFVAANVNLLVTGVSAFIGTTYGSAEIAGTVVAGVYGLFFTGASGQTTFVQVDETGIVSSVGANGNAIQIDSGGYDISNAGQITGDLGSGASAISVTGGGIIHNYGMIQGTLGGVENVDVTSSDNATLFNFGTISGDEAAVYDANGHSATVYNYGSIVGTGLFGAVYAAAGSKESLYNAGTITGPVALLTAGSSIDNAGSIKGDVTLGAAGSSLANSGTIDGTVVFNGGTLNSTLGSITGQIFIEGSVDTSATVIAGQTGGSVFGGAGTDILYANPTQTAAINAAKTTLDGSSGLNVLYGDGAFTTFIAGDNVGGYNQVWGGASQMAGVGGYTNNTLSFALAIHGVYVDLLNGHDAYVSSTTNWAGIGTFEDSIVNVPNVIGSSNGDLIQADTGIDRIMGLGGADSLYAGSGVGSQDTFVYTGYADSNLVTGYDTIVSFKLGTDKIDISALHTSAAHLALSNSGTSNTVYVEQTPGTFNKNFDLALTVNTTTTGGLHASDFVF